MQARKAPAYDSACDNVLLALLDTCEKAKDTLSSQLDDGPGKMEEFSLGVFANADKTDRESAVQPPDVSLAGRFYIASLFFDVVSQFYNGTLPPDLDEKRKYAKYRTLQIRNRQPLDTSVQADSTPPTSLSVDPVKPVSAAASQVSSTKSAFKYADEEVKPAVVQRLPTVPSPVVEKLNKPDAAGAKKKLQQAISALEFSDWTTAISLSNEAISLLKQ